MHYSLFGCIFIFVMHTNCVLLATSEAINNIEKLAIANSRMLPYVPNTKPAIILDMDTEAKARRRIMTMILPKCSFEIRCCLIVKVSTIIMPVNIFIKKQTQWRVCGSMCPYKGKCRQCSKEGSNHVKGAMWHFFHEHGC